MFNKNFDTFENEDLLVEVMQQILLWGFGHPFTYWSQYLTPLYMYVLFMLIKLLNISFFRHSMIILYKSPTLTVVVWAQLTTSRSMIQSYWTTPRPTLLSPPPRNCIMSIKTTPSTTKTLNPTQPCSPLSSCSELSSSLIFYESLGTVNS